MAINYWHKYDEGFCYHIYNRCTTEINLFQSAEMCDFFLHRLKKYVEPFIHVYAYCLMPNHFHLLVRIKNKSEIKEASIDYNESNKLKQFHANEIALNDVIEDQMRRLFSRVVLRFNKITKRIGPVFTERMKRISLHSELEVIDRLCYIHHNPIHHLFAIRFENWEYSSYNSFINGKHLFLGQKEINANFFRNQNEFIETHERYKLNKI